MFGRLAEGVYRLTRSHLRGPPLNDEALDLLNMNFKKAIDRKPADRIGSGISNTLQFITDGPANYIRHGKDLGKTALSNERI